MFTYLRICKTVCVFLVLATSPLVAQVQSRITGTVTDDTGAVIPGVQVTMTNIATGVSYTALSNDAGLYTFPSIPPAEYQLDCEFPGFKKFVRMGLVLETALTKTIDVRLEVGQLTETVQVTAATPLLESESSTVGQFIERAMVANMPLETRRAAGLIRLMGNVVYRESRGGEALPMFAMAGGRSRNQMWHLDGTVIQNMALGIAQLGLNPPAESLQEFKAEMSNYSAEFGRSAGGFMVMTTRSGTNEFHGAVYEFLRNDVLDARSFFAREKAPLRFNIFGVSVGGPIVKGKTFWFFNYEGARKRLGVTRSGRDVPHPLEISGDFSNRTDLTLKDPLTGDPFPNNIIPASRMDPLGRAFAQLYPAPNIGSGDLSKAPKDNFIGNTAIALTQDFYTARVDHTLSDNDRIFGRFMFSRAPQDNPAVFPNAFTDPDAAKRSNRHTNFTTSWIHNFSPTFLNDFRYNFGQRLHINRGAGTGSGKNGELGVAGVNPDAFARITVTDLTNLGQGNHERIQTPILTHQIINQMTWIRGTHQIRTGFEFRYAANKDDFNQSTGGRFSFSDRATGSGLATLLLGWTTSAELVDADILFSRTDNYAAFIQDDWKVTPTFTLNLGLRWEMDTPRWEKEDNRQSGFDPSAINPVCDCPGIVTFSGRGDRSKYAHDFDKNNFGPRIGLAWRAIEGLVIRAGYGINYNGAYARAVPFTQFNGFSLSGSFRSPDGGFTPAFLFKDGMPSVPRGELAPAFGAVPIGEKPRLSPDFFQQSQVNGYAQQWNLTVQKEMLENLLFEVAYLGNAAHKLGGANVNLNMIPLVNGRGPAKQDQKLRPFPQFNNVFLESPPWGNSSYHSVNFKLEKRYSQGLNFLMNYTWSKFLDDVESATELGGEQGNGYTHISLRHLDKAVSGNDVRHRFIGSGVYELPFGRGRRWDIDNSVLNAIAGDWGLGVIAELRTGVPFGVIEKTNRSNTFAHAQRPNLVRDPILSSNRPLSEKLEQWFDTSAFEAPGKGVFGNAPRNICCGPGFIGIDLSVHKQWVFQEPYKLQFRTDFYNLPNHPNFRNPGLRRGRPDFGRISNIARGTDGRLIQFSLRFEW
ncbi:TonB-dependent receptor [Acidobacteria bacterium AH-259-O06]|nr:TonB-dependent receptor [Acidobacteria bacterium AH-259-O06]